MASFVKVKDNNWSVQFYYNDYTGKKKRKHKCGFATKKDAGKWAEEFLRREEGNVDMTFESFYAEYISDIKNDIRETSLVTKEHIIELHIMPYFKDMKLTDIDARCIKKWQNEIKKKGFSPSYLSTIHSQLSAIFNHACRIYDLKGNPCKIAGTMGKKRKGNLGVWSQDDIEKFLVAVSDKPAVMYAFFLMYWTGIRVGELLALNIGDIDFDKGTLSVTKSLNRTGGRDIITEPKTESGIRTIHLPQFVTEGLETYCNMLYGRTKNDRLFIVTKSHLEKEMERGARLAGLSRIRIHDLRHSHASLLISKGVNIAAISNRLGHESVRTTLGTYAHIFHGDSIKVAELLDESYGGGGD